MLTQEIFAAPEESSWAVMKKSANAFQAYHHDFMMPRLNQMNRYWYNMFRDHRLFEALIPSFWAVGTQEIDHFYGANFVTDDINLVVGAGTADFQTYSKAVLDILEPSFDSVTLTKDAIKQVRALSEQWRRRLHDRYPGNKWGRYLRKYDNCLRIVPGKHERDISGKYRCIQCVGCIISPISASSVGLLSRIK